MIAEDFTRVKDYLTKAKSENLDFVINPYVGCPHKCLYCYASYMSNFSKHTEQWGDFIDIKRTNKKINLFKIKNKKVMVGTVTDPYNPYEEKYGITRMLMEQLSKSEAFISVVTKSKLVLKDIDLFKKTKNIQVILSICTTNEKLKSKLEPNSSTITERIETLKILNGNGIRTIVFISPILPNLTDYKEIIDKTKDYTDEYWFDKLNLRSSFKTKMFSFIENEYPNLKTLYNDIYNNKNHCYFEDLKKEIAEYCNNNSLSYQNFFAGT